MWTDIAEQIDDANDDDEQKQAAPEATVESYDSLLARLRALCTEYGSVHGRVDFFEHWQVGDNSGGGSGKRSSDSDESVDSLNGSQLSPSEVRRTTSLATAADVRNKLDQFRQSLTAHLSLVGRWSAASRRRMVDELAAAVGEWTGSGGQTTKLRRQQQQQAKEEKEAEDGDGTDTESEHSDSGEEEEEEEEEYNDGKVKQEDGEDDDEDEDQEMQGQSRADLNDEMVADSQQVST